MTKLLNRREFTRVSTYLEAEINSGGEALIPGVTRDLSLRGAFISCSDKLPVHTQCRLLISFGEEHNARSIQTSGEIVRVEKAGVVVRFDGLDRESSGFLRRFIEEHAGESAGPSSVH